MGTWDKGKLSDSPGFHAQSIAKSINENETCKFFKVTASKVHPDHCLQFWKWLQEHRWRWKIRKGDYSAKERAGRAFQEKKKQHRAGIKVSEPTFCIWELLGGGYVCVFKSGLLHSASTKAPAVSLEAYRMCRTMKVNTNACIFWKSLLLPALPLVTGSYLSLSSHQRWDLLLGWWLLIVLFLLSSQQHPSAEIGVLAPCWHKRCGQYLSCSPLESPQPFPALSVDGASSVAAENVE